MRKAAKAILLVVISFLGTIGLAIGAAFSAALAYGAVALIVPGTGTPNANIVENYRENARDYYFQGTACSNEGNCPADTALQGINYPASFFPLVIFPSWCRSGPEGCDTWDTSVGQGANGGPLGPGLTSELRDALATPGTSGQRDIIVFGYSQGGAVVSKVLNEYGLTDAEQQRIQVVTIGGIENPDGGLWQRLAFLRYIPFLDITFAPPMPIDPDLKTTTIGFQYDPVVYAPRYWGNPLAMLNALAAFQNVHGYYLEPNGNDGDTPETLPYGYTPPGATGPNLNPLEDQLDCSATGHPENCRYDSVGNTYIMIPATSLPMFDLVTSVLPAPVKPFVQPFIDLISPVTKVLVDLGYDFSGDPGTPTPLSILPFNPFQNWLEVGVKLAAASIEGVQKFISGIGQLGSSATMLAPNSTPSTQVPALSALSRLAPQSNDAQQDVVGADNDKSKVTTLAVDHQSPVDEPVTPVVNDPVKTTPPATDPVVVPVTSTPPVSLVVDNTKDEKKDESKSGETEKKDKPTVGVVNTQDEKKDEPAKVDPPKSEPAKNDTDDKTDDKKVDDKKAA